MEKKTKKVGKEKREKKRRQKKGGNVGSADDSSETEGLLVLPVEVLLLLVNALADRDFPSLWALRYVCRTFHDLINSYPVLGNVPQYLLMFPSVTAFNKQPEWRAFKGKLMQAALVSQQLEGRLNRAQDILKRLEGSSNAQAVEGEKKVCISRSHTILNHSTNF